MKNKFKVGDKVFVRKLYADEGVTLEWRGVKVSSFLMKIGTIKEVSDKLPYPYEIEFENVPNDKNYYSWSTHELEKYTPKNYKKAEEEIVEEAI